LKIADDLNSSMDSKSCSVLLSLDISAAFDMINIDILLSRLESEFGIIGGAASWLRSYLTDRRYYVAIGGSKSDIWVSGEGVPQGSVLGPLIFSGYVSPIARIFDYFGIRYHQYADDTQLYTSIKSASDVQQLIACVEEVTRWFLVNGLLLNSNKTEAIAFGTRQQLAKRTEEDNKIKFGDTEIVVGDKVKILGICLDSTLSMDSHVGSVVKACNYHMRALRHIRPFLTPEVARTISRGLVISRLDYCNSLLAGTSTSNIARLQRVQNSLARVVLRAPWRSGSKPLLKELHWLPIPQRVTFKIALLTFKTLHTKEPPYLHSLLHSYAPVRSLRSEGQFLLNKTKTLTVAASRAFRHSAPEIWNSIALKTRRAASVGIFKNLLKTELFLSAFGP